ncbi:MAG: tRNA lysidine(34) synthetase TilS [Pseudomonadota bacterium]
MTDDNSAARDAVVQFYSEHPVNRLGVAVSGGSDSLALLVLLKEWGGADLHAITVNHGLRPDAASEVLHVAKVCRDLGVLHYVREWQGWDGKGNLQAEARRSRYSLIGHWARYTGIDAVAVGHTRDDQAETVLMRLARGAGVEGLASMRAVVKREGFALHRPLLPISRVGLRDILTKKGIKWVDDPSNKDENYERVRVRQALEVLAPLGVDASALARVAHNLEDARFAIAWSLAKWAEEGVRVDAGDVIFDRTRLLGLPAEMRRQAVSLALRWISGADYAPRSDALTGLFDAIRNGENATLHGCFVMNSTMTVRATREAAAVAGVKSPAASIWDGRWRLDGPHDDKMEIRALGQAISRFSDWRETGLPRATLLASPSVWQDDTLIAAPVAGLSGGWTAKAGSKSDFVAFLISH